MTRFFFGRSRHRQGDPEEQEHSGTRAPPETDCSAAAHHALVAAATSHDLATEAPIVGEIRTDFLPTMDVKSLFRLPTAVADAGILGTRWAAAASFTGLSHATDGRTGQDSYAFALGDDESIAFVVSDGLGSKERYSHVGAVTFARVLAVRLLSLDATSSLTEPGTSVTALVREASREAVSLLESILPGVDPSEYATVLAGCWMPSGLNRAGLALRVGDATAFALRRRQFEPAFPRGEGPLNYVEASLPADNPSVEVAPLPLHDIDAVALVTDGLADDIYGSPRIREWLSEAWSKPCTTARMIDSLRFRRRGSLDDKTAAVVWLDSTRRDQPSEK